MNSIFINHSTQDAGFAQKLATDLGLGGYQAVTYADLESARGGKESNLKERLAGMIASSDYFIPVITSAVQDRGWFQQDIVTALQEEAPSGRVIILPVLKEPCVLPESLGVRSPVDFSESYEKGLHNLVDRLSVRLPDRKKCLASPGLSSVEPGVMNGLRERRDHLKQLSSQPVSNRLEKLVVKIFEDQGYRVELAQLVKDGDIDLVAVGGSDRSKHRFLAQCKWYAPGNRVAVELVNSVSPRDISRDGKAHVVTTSSFADSAGSASGDVSERLTCSRWELNPPDWDSMRAWMASFMNHLPEQPVDLDQTRDRHAELVDKKYGSFLTETEQEELLRLRVYLDEAQAEFYKPIEKKLDLALAALNSSVER